MSKTEFSLPDDFAEKLAKLGDKTDEIVPKVLEAGGKIIFDKVRTNLGSVLSGESSGELARSLGMTKARVNRNGGYDLKIGFYEKRTDGKTNAFSANVIEYGKVNQPPKPFLKPARRQSESAATAAMSAKFESETEALL